MPSDPRPSWTHAGGKPERKMEKEPEPTACRQQGHCGIGEAGPVSTCLLPALGFWGLLFHSLAPPGCGHGRGGWEGSSQRSADEWGVFQRLEEEGHQDLTSPGSLQLVLEHTAKCEGQRQRKEPPHPCPGRAESRDRSPGRGLPRYLLVGVLREEGWGPQRAGTRVRDGVLCLCVPHFRD